MELANNKYKIKLNKKADISITILVIGVVAVCMLTIFSFMSQEREDTERLYGPGLIETINSIDKEMELSEEIGFGTIYDGSFEKGNVNIEISDSQIKGVYVDYGQNWIKSCDGTKTEFFEKCPKKIVEVVYKKQ